MLIGGILEPFKKNGRNQEGKTIQVEARDRVKF